MSAMRNVIMPTLGLDMEEATIQTWLKREGEAVAKDEPLLVVETDKASVEINAPATGVLRQILHREGSIVPVTHAIAVIETDEPAEPEAEAVAVGSASHPAPEAVMPRAGVMDLAAPPAEFHGLRASPAARQLARTLGVPLQEVRGTGPRGRIQGEDVQRFADDSSPRATEAQRAGEVATQRASSALTSLPGLLLPLSRKRKLTAERMAQSARSVARITLNAEIDAGELVQLRSRLLPTVESIHGVRLSYNDLLIRAVAAALRDHPLLNARWTEQGIYLVDAINIGVAVEVDDGLVVPVIRQADRKELGEISAELNRLTVKAREDRLALEDIADGTFTLTNLGMFGIDSFTPLVNPPESAILGVGRIAERPVGREGQIVLRPMMTLCLSVDHRVVDGAPAARFLQRVRQLLEEPQLLQGRIP